MAQVLTWYEDDESGTPYGKGSDVWSLGVLLYVILSGCSPFSADEEDAILQLVAEAKYEFHDAEWAHVSADAKDLIKQILIVDPAQRLTMQQMLEHSWLKEAVASARAVVEAAPQAKALQKSRPPTRTADGMAVGAGAGAAPGGGKEGAAGGTTANGSASAPPTIQPTIQSVGGRKSSAATCPLELRTSALASAPPVALAQLSSALFG